MKEIWKPIDGYEGLYEVSNLGNVRKLRFINNRTNKNKVFEIAPQHNGKGYLKVALYIEGTCKQKLVHRLVAEAFIPRIKGREFVNHIDGNKENNAVSNLEWCTRSENMIHAYRVGLATPSAKGKYGKDNAKSIRVDMYDKQGNYLMSFGSLIDAARYVGASKSSHICSCCKGKLKSAYGYVWRYAND